MFVSILKYSRHLAQKRNICRAGWNLTVTQKHGQDLASSEGGEHMTSETKEDLEEAASQLSLSLVSIPVPWPTVPWCHESHLSPSVVWETVIMTKLHSSFSLLPPVARSRGNSRDDEI